MVTISNYAQRTNAEGENFFALILQGGVEMMQSKETGKYYATAKHASVTSTFDEQTCKNLIGSQLPGSIKKIATDPYEYTIKETGEVISLTHHWAYVPEGDTVEENVFEGKVESSLFQD